MMEVVNVFAAQACAQRQPLPFDNLQLINLLFLNLENSRCERYSVVEARRGAIKHIEGNFRSHRGSR